MVSQFAVRVFGLAFLLSAATVPARPARGDDSPPLEFNRDIRPLLSDRCFTCHGIDSQKRQADLRLDTREGATANRDGSAAIVPGSPAKSELWARISSPDPDLVMPPPASRKTLTEAERDVLRRWIEQGAAYQQHWSFEAPALPAPPEVAGAPHPVDQFIRARLATLQLEPQREAPRETLIRRAAFALTGLPPTVAEVDAYLQDRDPTAYEKMVDRYLASERFGEEQARHWLDIARYADTHGLHLDNERGMWAYRDWVVSAYNRNLPFDEFTVWQLAGDLLPDATVEQRIATGFNRCNVTTSEGGSIAPEWIYRYAVDRTSTTVQAWMGLTAGCAVCHDHKFDPLSAREFYSLYAFFNSAADPAMDGNIKNAAPVVAAPDESLRAELTAAKARESQTLAALHEAIEKALQAPRDEPLEKALQLAPPQQQTPQQTPQETPPPEASPAAARRRAVDDILIDDEFPLGATVRNTSRNPVTWRRRPAFDAPLGERVVELEYGGPYEITVDLPTIPVITPHRGSLSCWIRVDRFDPPKVFAIQVGAGKKTRQAVWGDVSQLQSPQQPHQAGPLPPLGKWTQVSVALETLQLQPGDRIDRIELLQTGGRMWLDGLRLSGELAAAEDPRSSLRAFWEQSRGGRPADVPEPLRKLLSDGPQPAAPPEQLALAQKFFLQHVQRLAESPVREARQRWEQARLATARAEEDTPQSMTFEDLASPRDAFVMIRGQYDQAGEKVTPATPAFLPPLGAAPGTRPTRLDLARWLVSPEHPLTARVAVNRIWQQLFGLGLVRTSDDFGVRGELPSHPALLDWLAVHYRESGWDTKALIRLLVTSATFRQDSAMTDEAYRRDPENRFLARGPRFRLDAEQLRDNALFTSGLLQLQMGGRGVRPYQPPNLWEPVGYENSNTRFFLADHGPALYRRSIYCFLKRTAPPPFMTNFDGPNREQLCARRERSNTPLQALQLMNDVQHFEAARALAERVLAAATETAPGPRIDLLYRIALARRPDDDERRLVLDALERQRRLFAENPQAAKRVVESGESAPRRIADDVETAAWTMLANLILNLDETLNRN